jgi:pimeloyl-ACP methyl ester carboxylesterase
MPAVTSPGFRHLACALALLLAACVAPVTVEQTDGRTSYQRLNRNALSSNAPSEASLNTLRQRALLETYALYPVETIRALHGWMLIDESPADDLFALSELSYLQARGLQGREEEARPDYLAAAIYAYAFLFPEDPRQRPDPYDPRFRWACDLYNLSLSAALSNPEGTSAALLAGRQTLPFGSIDITPDDTALQLEEGQVLSLVPTINLKVSGFRNLYRSAGVGAPMAASPQRQPASGQGLEVAPRLRVPTAVVLHIPNARRQLAAETLHGTLSMHSIFGAPSIQVRGQQVPLEFNQTAARAFSLAQSAPWTSEYRGFLFGDLFDGPNTSRLVALEPHRRGRMPVVLVHGTASSPFRWADMVNDLHEDPLIRDNFEFWFFSYATGNPIPYSAMALRDSLEAAFRQLGGEAADPALRHMVVMGHSQGGLLTKMLVIDPGDDMWNALSTRPLDSLTLRPQSKELLRRALFPKPLPQVSRVIFVATPHGGSYVSAYSIAHLVGRLVTLPATVISTTGDMLNNNASTLSVDRGSLRIGSVYGMTPGSLFIQAMGRQLIVPGVHAHSIIPTLGDGPLAERTDGVVQYSSAHIAGVDSELVIEGSGHSTQSNPRTINEVRRILRLHLATVCGDARGCGPMRR